MESWHDLTMYERDLLIAVGRAQVQLGRPPHGQEATAELNSIRLSRPDVGAETAYTTLRELADRNLIAVLPSLRDKRSNLYVLTDPGIAVVNEVGECCGRIVAADKDGLEDSVPQIE